jgi:hypothetical protein
MRNLGGPTRRHARTGTMIGWGVFRPKPWDFAGLFGSSRQADAKAQEMGVGYIARFGELQDGTDNFEWSLPENRDEQQLALIVPKGPELDHGSRHHD